MKYQPRYVAYLALIGGEEEAANYNFISFIGIMIHQYESFRGVPEETPISDQKEFTAFIQQWVSLHNHSAPGTVQFTGVDLGAGPDRGVYAKMTDKGLEITGAPNPFGKATDEA